MYIAIKSHLSVRLCSVMPTSQPLLRLMPTPMTGSLEGNAVKHFPPWTLLNCSKVRLQRVNVLRHGL